MKKGKIVLILLLITNLIYCQDEAIVEINNLLNEYEEKIDKQTATIKIYESKIRKLTKSKYSDKSELQEAIQKRHFADLQLQKLQKSFSSLVVKNKGLLVDNNNLKDQVTNLEKVIESQNAKIKGFTTNLSTTMGERGNSELYQEALSHAEKDFYSGKKSTSLGFFNKTNPLIFFNTGYRIVQGTHFDLNFGTIINNDKNIFLGLGALYHFFGKQDQAMMGVYFSSKIALGYSFLSGKELEEDVFVYFIGDLGYSFSLGNSTQIKGGLFTNIGLGYPIYVSENIYIDTGISWRRLNGQEKRNNEFDTRVFNSADVRIGLAIYLGR